MVETGAGVTRFKVGDEVFSRPDIMRDGTYAEEVVRGIDVVFDSIGGDTQERSWQVLNKGGILVSIISPPAVEKAAALGVRQAFVFIGPDALTPYPQAESVR